MKKIFSILSVVFFATALLSVTAWGQATGDFRAKATGNWSSLTTWEVFNGTTYDAASQAPDGTKNVFINTSNSGGTVGPGWIVTIDANAACNNLTMIGVSAGAASSGPILQFASSGSITLTANGAVSVTAGSGGGSGNRGGRPQLASNGNASATLTIFGNITSSSSNTSANGNAGFNMNEGNVIIAGSSASTATISAGTRWGNLQIGDGTNTKTFNFKTSSSSQTIALTSLTIKANCTFNVGDAANALNASIGFFGSGSVNLTGGITVESGASLVVLAGSAAVNPAGNLNLYGGGITNNGTVTLNSGGGFPRRLTVSVVSGTNPISGNSISADSVIVYNGATVTQTGDVSVASGKAFANSGTLNCGSNLVSGSGGFTLSGSTVTPTGNTTNASTTIAALSSTAGIAPGMAISGTGIPASTYVTGVIGTTITISQSATATASSVALTISGAGTVSTTNSGGLDGSITASGTKTFLDGANYTFNGATITPFSSGQTTISANNLTNGAAISLNKPVSVLGTLTLTSGNITTTNTNLLTLGSAATLNGGSSSSFVNGPMAHTWIIATATKTYPLGKGATYRPLDIALTTPQSPVLSAEVFNANAGGSSALNAISTVRYYQTSLVSGTAVSGGTVKITYGVDDGVSDFSQLVVAICTTVNGTYLSLGGTGDATSVTSVIAYDPGSGSFLRMGSTGANVLPVEITSFTALARGSKVELNWNTATEVNNYGFEVERKTVSSEQLTVNSKQLAVNSWAKVGFVDGHGTTNAPQNYSFSDNSTLVGKYSYRLKQIDRDGKFEYSKSVESTVGIAPNTIVLGQNYPNPFNPETNIEFAVPVSGRTTLKVYNMLGEEVATLVNGNIEAGVIQHASFKGTSLPSGLYFYTLRSGNFVDTKKMMMVK